MLWVAAAVVLEAVEAAVSVLDDLPSVLVGRQAVLRQEVLVSEIQVLQRDRPVQDMVSLETAAKAQVVAAMEIAVQVTGSLAAVLPRRVDLETETSEREKSRFTRQDQFFMKDT
jgi:hypothetical protein